MQNTESYMHHYAKDVMRQWCIDRWKYNDQHRYPNTFCIFDWKIDHRDSNHGVYLEYPILVKSNGNHVLGVNPCWKSYPDLNNLADDVKVEAILDLAIVEDGRLKYGIEIVHKHLCSARKRKFLKNRCPEVAVYEISAEWILSQLRDRIPPKSLPLVPI